MTVSPSLFSSNKADWTTPQYLFDKLNEEFHFTLDAAATDANKKCARYLGPDHEDPKRRDALTFLWRDAAEGAIWCNPPYPVKPGWIDQAQDAWGFGFPVVMLVPARTDTRWWTEAAMCVDEIRFISGRLKFGNAEAGAPFPSALLIWGVPEGCISRTRPVTGWWDYR